MSKTLRPKPKLLASEPKTFFLSPKRFSKQPNRLGNLKENSPRKPQAVLDRNRHCGKLPKQAKKQPHNLKRNSNFGIASLHFVTLAMTNAIRGWT